MQIALLTVVNFALKPTSFNSVMSSLGQWLRPSRTVPTTPWSAGQSNWKAKPATYVVLLAGLWLFGAGEAAFVSAGIGVSPWVVFAQGISLQTGLSIGWSTFYTSAAILLLWIPLKRKPGAGTIANMIVIAIALEVMTNVYPHPTERLWQLVFVFLGVGMTGVASALYITCNLGTGPRDGLMTGIHERTGIRIGRVRLIIEVIVLTIGWLLGGTVGVGTVFFALLIGQSFAVALSVVTRLTGGNPHA